MTFYSPKLKKLAKNKKKIYFFRNMKIFSKKNSRKNSQKKSQAFPKSVTIDFIKLMYLGSCDFDILTFWNLLMK